MRSVWGWAGLGLLLAGCGLPFGGEPARPTLSPTPSASATQTLTPSLAPSLTPTATQTLTPTPTALPTLTPTPPQPPECLEPPADLTLVEVNGGMYLNQRTWWMLQRAKDLYGGELEITGWGITQGSYSPGVSASFGTHDGGGAVDLAVMRTGTWEVLYEEIPPLLRALRLAGFAAWLRDLDELYPGSPIHIHAVAVGDPDLSPAAYRQVDGLEGYFRGFDGVPQPEGAAPKADRFGGPVVCTWMCPFIENGAERFAACATAGVESTPQD